ncbi:hypothetical protein E2C01_045885 [Portunus trituberculatus]|uniref:Uncharacterized protein n=1 Tax=Portunus trituberculatus TaxID=210409 RepID=A0A5B7G2L0_PORTR|nr:hypothetical protein [Portunus trituberculatus]
MAEFHWEESCSGEAGGSEGREDVVLMAWRGPSGCLPHPPTSVNKDFVESTRPFPFYWRSGDDFGAAFRYLP